MRATFPLPILAFLTSSALLCHASVTLTNDTLVGSTNLDFEGLDLVVTNCTVTIDGGHSFASLRILSGGILTHSFAASGSFLNQFQITNEAHVASSNTPPTLAQPKVNPVGLVVTDSATNVTYARNRRTVLPFWR